MNTNIEEIDHFLKGRVLCKEFRFYDSTQSCLFFYYIINNLRWFAKDTWSLCGKSLNYTISGREVIVTIEQMYLKEMYHNFQSRAMWIYPRSNNVYYLL